MAIIVSLLKVRETVHFSCELVGTWKTIESVTHSVYNPNRHRNVTNSGLFPSQLPSAITMTERNVPSSNGLDSTNISLLARVRSNEGPAWEVLVELYAPMIYSRCRHHWSLSPPDAENVGQEVFKSVAKSISGFRRKREGSFRKWLRVIVDNKCRDHFRKKSVSVGLGGTHALDLFAAIVDEVDNKLEESGSSELSEKAILMRQAMQMVQEEFSPRDWKIFWAIAVEDKDRKDTAKTFDVSDNVVYLALSRIRSRLKNTFEDLLDDDIYPKDDRE